MSRLLGGSGDRDQGHAAPDPYGLLTSDEDKSESSFEGREATSSLRRSPRKLRGQGQGEEGLGMEAGQLPIAIRKTREGGGRKRLCTFFPEETFAEKVVEAWKELGGVTIPYSVYQEEVLGTVVQWEVPVFINLELLFKRKRQKYLNDPWPRNAFRMEYIRHLRHWGKTKKVQLKDFMLSPPGEDGVGKVLVKDVIRCVEERKRLSFDREDSQSQELPFPAPDSRDKKKGPGAVQQSPLKPKSAESVQRGENEETFAMPAPVKTPAGPLTFVTQSYRVPTDPRGRIIRIKKKSKTDLPLPSSSRKVADRTGKEWLDNSGIDENNEQVQSAPASTNQRILGSECSQPKKARMTSPSKSVGNSTQKAQQWASTPTNASQRVSRLENIQQENASPSKAVRAVTPAPKTPESEAVKRDTRASAAKSTPQSATKLTRQVPSTSQNNRTNETSKSPASASDISLLDSSDEETENNAATANTVGGQNLGQAEDDDVSDYFIEDSEASQRQTNSPVSVRTTSFSTANASKSGRFKKYYSDQDDRLMLELIILNKWVRHAKGNSLWEFLERKKILFGGERPAKGMRERFIKRILPKVGERPCPFRFLTSKQVEYVNIEVASAKRNQHSCSNAFLEPPVHSVLYPNKNKK